MQKNKTLNSVLFVILATLFNLIAMLVLFISAVAIFGAFVSNSVPVWVNQVMLVVLFVGSTVATYCIYHALIRRLSKRPGFEKYLLPTFRGGRRWW